MSWSSIALICSEADILIDEKYVFCLSVRVATCIDFHPRGNPERYLSKILKNV